MIPAIYEMMLAVSRSLAASIVVKATVLVALGLCGAWMARKGRAAVRHALLASAFGMLLILPVASLVSPPIRIMVPAAARQQAVAAPSEIVLALPTGGSVGVPSAPPRVSIATLLLTAWLAGLALFASPVLLGLWQVRSLRRSALPWAHGQAALDGLAPGLRRNVAVLLHEGVPGPMTCGVVRPAIVLPLNAGRWDEQDLNRALVHELEHVRRHDWVSQCLARAVCSLYWFHPLAWMAWRQLTLEAERSCDDAVLGRSDATAYADQLVGLAQHLSAARKAPLLAMVSRSDLAARVGAVLDHRQRRGRAGTLAVALACGAAAALVLTLSPFRMVAAPASPAPAPAIPIPVAAAIPEPVAEPAPAPPPQNPGPAPQRSSVQFSSRSQLVMINVTVTDLAGNSIDGLGARDFVLTEDGVSQTISTFEFQKVAGAASGSYYILGYYPKNESQDGQFRKIQIIDKNDTTAKVEYRSGYYPNKQFVDQAPDAAPGSRVLAPAAPLPPGTTPPVLVFKKEPAYSEEARQAKYQGTVVLSVEVNETGTASNIHVLRSIGLGLDEKAIEAVKQWKFKPAMTNGVPVAMQTEVKVDFRLL